MIIITRPEVQNLDLQREFIVQSVRQIEKIEFKEKQEVESPGALCTRF